MADHYNDLLDFHTKFQLPLPMYPTHLNPELLQFRTKFLHEELLEFTLASQQADMEGMADALIDLVYVAIGTAQLMGLPWNDLWDEVHRANMSKERAQSAGDSKRGTAFDVVKPEGWQPPRIYEIIGAHRP